MASAWGVPSRGSQEADEEGGTFPEVPGGGRGGVCHRGHSLTCTGGRPQCLSPQQKHTHDDKRQLVRLQDALLPLLWTSHSGCAPGLGPNDSHAQRADHTDGLPHPPFLSGKLEPSSVLPRASFRRPDARPPQRPSGKLSLWLASGVAPCPSSACHSKRENSPLLRSTATWLPNYQTHKLRTPSSPNTKCPTAGQSEACEMCSPTVFLKEQVPF